MHEKLAAHNWRSSISRALTTCGAIAALSAWLDPSLALAQNRARDAQNATRMSAPRPLFTPKVPYPEGARGDAAVLLDLDIAENGSVVQVRVLRGEEPFATAAQRGVSRWRYVPARRNGLPVRVGISVTLAFEEPPPLIPALPAQSVEPELPELPVDEPLAEVVVRRQRRKELGAAHIPTEEARLIPGTFADPLRVAEVLPGMAPVLSGLPYFYVRGAPPGNVAYMIDDVRVPLLFHVGAGSSILAPSLVERVDVMPSAYPARFGRSAGGVISGQTTPQSPLARGEIQSRIFDTSALIEVPLADSRLSLLAGGRYSYVQPLLDRVSPDYDLAYWDYQGRVAYQLDTRNSVSVFAFGASDDLYNRTLGVKLFDTEFHRIDLRWDRATDTSESRFAITLGTDRVANAEEAIEVYSSEREDRAVRLRWNSEQKLARGVELRTGLDYGLNRVTREESASLVEVEAYPERFDLSGSFYVDTVLRAPGVEVVPGLRTEGALWRDRGYFFLEPRLGSRVELFSDLAWISQLGLTHQLPTQAVRAPGLGAGPLESSIQAAWQAAQGLEVTLPAKLSGRVTGFHSWIDSNAPSLTGRSYGLEVFLRRDFLEDFGGIFSYTLSRTETTRGRVTEPAEFDRTHVFTGVIGWNIGAGFRLGLRGHYVTGRVYQIFCPTPGCGPGDPEAPRDFWIRRRTPDFYRVDARFEKRWEFGYSGWFALTFEWFNATLSDEVTQIAWSPTQGGTVAVDEQGPLTMPSIGIEAGF